MNTIIITVIACATAITCAILLRADRSPTQARYQLYGIDETSSANGKTVKSVYRLDALSGKTWRLLSNPVQTAAQDAQNNPIVTWADGWEEMPESREAAVAKAQTEWQRAMKH
jgi:hypothetical protein